MPQVKLNFIRAFIEDELPAFEPIIQNRKKDDARKWIERFREVLTNYRDVLEQDAKSDDLEEEFRQYESEFYRVVIDEGLAAALGITKDEISNALAIEDEQEVDDDDSDGTMADPSPAAAEDGTSNASCDNTDDSIQETDDKSPAGSEDQGNDKVELPPNVDSELWSICFKIVYDLACKSLGIDNGSALDNKPSPQRNPRYSERLRHYPRLKIKLPLEDCKTAPSDLWKYIGEMSSVTRNGAKIKIKRLLTFKRTAPHRLLTTYLAGDDFGFSSWLKKVLLRIGDQMYKPMKKPPESKDDASPDDPNSASRQKKLEEFMALAAMKAGCPEYIQRILTTHYAYYEILHEIMSEGSVKQYENWLLRFGFYLMIYGPVDDAKDQSKSPDKKNDPGVEIHDTSAILACLGHEGGRAETTMRNVTIWANKTIWTQDQNKNRSKVTNLVRDAKANILKVNSLILNQLGNQKPGRDEKEKTYFSKLFQAKGTFGDHSVAKLPVAFQKLVEREAAKENGDVKPDEMAMNRLVENMDEEGAFEMREAYNVLIRTSLFRFLTHNVTDEEVNSMMTLYDLYSVYDQIHVYFSDPSTPEGVSPDCRVCHDLLDVPGLSKETYDLLMLEYIRK